MESQSFQCKLQLLLPLMPVTHIRGWARNPEGRFSPCSPLLETGGARARSQGVRGAVYLLRPACPGTSICIFSSWWLRTAGSIRSHWAPAIDYLKKKKKSTQRREAVSSAVRLGGGIGVCVCWWWFFLFLFLFFFFFSFFFLSFLFPFFFFFKSSLLGTTQWQSSLSETNPAQPPADSLILIAIK